MSTKYTPELEEQAVALYLKSSTTYAAVARELGCDPGSLSDWIKKATNADRSQEDNPFQMQEEIRQLRCENARLKEENEILLEASAFFATKTM
jgi:Transposase and inactivated derivatives